VFVRSRVRGVWRGPLVRWWLAVDFMRWKRVGDLNGVRGGISPGISGQESMHAGKVMCAQVMGNRSTNPVATTVSFR